MSPDPGAPRDCAAAPSANLFMIGMALAPCDPADQADAGRFSSPDAFRRVKRTRAELRAVLEWVRDEGALAEAFVWDTCQRTELYGWLADGPPPDGAARDRVVARVRDRLFGAEPPGLAVRAAAGAGAWRHLLRTAAGLESRVPGDRDVLAQLQTAWRIAASVGAAGNLGAALVAGAASLVERLRAGTRWGAISAGYVAASLDGIPELRHRAAAARHVVIGGSTTSRSILEALRTRLRVGGDRLTLIYRGHHGQMKPLREALGGGRRLHVAAYGEPAVLAAAAEADFVYFGLDQAEPVVDPGRLAALRDLAARPRVMVDYNTFGSLGPGPAPRGTRVWRAADLEEAVAVHAARVRSGPDWPATLAEAAAWLDRHVADATGSGSTRRDATEPVAGGASPRSGGPVLEGANRC